jgi:hypothetical protein
VPKPSADHSHRSLRDTAVPVSIGTRPDRAGDENPLTGS